MKFIFTVILSLFLLNISFAQGGQGNHQQISYSQFLNVLSDVPKLFTSWLDAVNKIADRQDREKFAVIAGNISYRINKLENEKKRILFLLSDPSNPNIPNEKWDMAIKSMRAEIDTLDSTLGATHRLTSQYNLGDAVAVVNALSSDFTQKDFMLDQLAANSTGRTNEQRDLNAAIGLLEDAQKKLRAFISKLRAQ